MSRALILRLSLAIVAVFLLVAMRGDAQTASITAPATPQPQASKEVHRVVDAQFLLLEGTAGAASAADVRTSCAAFRRGYIESSAVFPAHSCAGVVAGRAIVTIGVGAVSYIAMRYGGSTGRRAGKVLLAFETAIETGAAVHNARLR